MLSDKTVKKEKAFVVTPIALSRLVSALPIDSDRLTFKVNCVDGTTLYPNSIEELLAFPNPKTREIQTIEISTSYGSDSSRCQIRFSTDIMGPVSYRVSGQDAYVVSSSDIIEQHLESFTSGGTHFISTSFVIEEFAGAILLTPALLLTFAGLAACAPIIMEHKHLSVGSVKLGNVASTMLLVSGLVFLFITVRFEKLRGYFFPKGSFCIGDGEARYRRMIERRKLFGIGALVALIIGILGSYIANMLPTH